MTTSPTSPIDRTAQLWRGYPDRLRVDCRPLVGGARRDLLDCATFEIRSPITDTVITLAPDCDDRDVDDAVRAARTEFDHGDWPRTPPPERSAALTSWAEAIEAHADELAVLICWETGKPVRDCLEIDVTGVARAIRWYAAAIGKHAGAHPDTGIQSLAFVAREPAGVIAAITPWNFPLAQLGYEVAPALSLGNTVVIKPSEHAPLAVLRCAELAHTAGIPGAALAVLPGGRRTGAALGLHPGVDVVSVTGSPAAGRAFLTYSASSNAKRVWPEVGGKSTAIVCADTPDLDGVARNLVWGAYFNQGQMCTGISRVLVERAITTDLLAALSNAIDDLVLGDPMTWDTDIGPMITAAAARTVTDLVDAAVDDGATILRGGPFRAAPTSGAYVAPTLLTGAAPRARILTEEVFGPVATVLEVDSPDRAAELAAGFETGIAASIWTRNLDTALGLAKRLHVGTVWVNGFEADDLTVPAGGRGPSGYGRSKSLAVLEKYSDLKTTWITLNSG
ncbi:aldehyde dehydrogenase family protein [Nocardia sp. NPDC004604]|uniref:aldehyde dehydrogenase family protein n=1 Tax=Nocardia sp. NPDC004604 TaxID=3157013 RepID=UPI0033B8DF87